MTEQRNDKVPLPQTGWHLDERWADALHIEIKTFRENVRKYNAPFRMFGSAMFIQAEAFYEFLNGINQDEEKAG